MELSPEVSRERTRVERHASGFVGLTRSEVGDLAQGLGIQVRILSPGDLRTADFRPTRLNVLLDGAGRVATTELG